MTGKTLRIPLTRIRVRYRSGTRRPITELDRMIMQAIAAETCSIDRLKSIFQLPERLLVECLVDLMEMALLALDMNGSGFQLTEFGKRSLKPDGLKLDLASFGERVNDTEEMFFLREGWAGGIIASRQIQYKHEKGDLPPSDVGGNIPRGEIEKLLIQELKKDKKHLHSVESIDPVRDGISFEVTVDKGGTSGLPNQWSHLKALLQVKAEGAGSRHATPPQERRK